MCKPETPQVTKSSSVVSVQDDRKPAPVWKSPYDPSSNTPLPSKSELKAVIPAHCFERSLPRSLFYLARDFSMAVACAAAAALLLPTQLSQDDTALWLLQVAGWTAYACLMGTICTGMWVLAHECGHGAFSDYKAVNDAVGFVLHTPMLVPYFSWQYSHAKHHRRTNHLNDGESHVPGVYPKSEAARSVGGTVYNMLGDDGYAVLQILLHLCVGWPLYMMGVDATGRVGATTGKRVPPGTVLDHFRPNSAMFPVSMRLKAAVSTVGVAAVLFALYKAHGMYGHMPVVLFYWGPYHVINAWLVLYTWLQHTDVSLPHYDDDEWTWMKGALSTIDRPYGPILDFFHHRIGSTHVAHHLFHEMPWYNAKEATVALKDYLEPRGLYNYDPRSIVQAMWCISHTCHLVMHDVGTQYYDNMADITCRERAAKSSANKDKNNNNKNKKTM